jgi:hypothetical protein
MIRKPTRAEIAAEYRARATAAREAKRKDAERTSPFRVGGQNETVFGRFIGPGEMPSALPPASQRWPWEDER